MRTKTHCFTTTLDITSLLRQSEISASFHDELSFHLLKKPDWKEGDWSQWFLTQNASRVVNKWLRNLPRGHCSRSASSTTNRSLYSLFCRWLRKKKTFTYGEWVTGEKTHKLTFILKESVTTLQLIISPRSGVYTIHSTIYSYQREFITTL